MKNKLTRTPEEISKQNKKKNYSLSLIESNMDALAILASKSNLPLSALVDEAVLNYLRYVDARKR